MYMYKYLLLNILSSAIYAEWGLCQVSSIVKYVKLEINCKLYINNNV